ncbi:sensor histidine kinase [Paenibacillus rhizovicinus]|uniref:histidine kinase n=1 Tax=Paenibacillus rhizovicinus TaxID=2704463 RepID=A0A6C0NZT7_9BACL|nr:sensor histidine kinase [Paenibacillus rhizovicinus]QHW31737.1 sensor histidine kinase [Paenibacillus rhizovicinus]
MRDRYLPLPVRTTAGLAIIISLMYANDFFTGSPLRIALNILITATFASRFILRYFWKPKRRSLAFIGLITLETAAGIFWYDETTLIYFYAIVVLSTIVRLTFAQTRVPLLATMILIAGVYTALGDVNLLTFVSFSVISAFFYINVRSRRQRDSMYEQNKRHLAELQEAYAHLQEASVTSMQNAILDERTRIARDIHDAVGHSLTSLIVQMQAMRYMIGKDPAQAEQSLEGMLAVARQGLADIRSSVHALADDRSVSGLAPLAALLARMEATTSIRYTFHAELQEEDAATSDYALLFSVLQEAVTNIIRHSRATHVEVNLFREKEHIVLRIQDNGSLDAQAAVQEGFGLKMMRARLEERGGRLDYGIVQPHGFEIKAELPINGGPGERGNGDDSNVDDDNDNDNGR